MKFFKWLGFGLGIIGLIVVCGLMYFMSKYPVEIPVPDVKVEGTQSQIERGEYLANHVAVCIDCHSIRNWDYKTGPIKEETFGGGGEAFTSDMGLPGNLYSKNLTPAKTGLANWSDGEIFRAVTSGISKDGTALFPFMPYPSYARADQEDILAIIAYLRSLKPIENEVQARSLSFPMNLIVRSIPAPPNFQKRPDPADSVAYGEYLVNFAGCAECHTQQEKGKPLPGLEFAGGFAFPLPFGIVRSANITPDEETGIGQWTKEQFIARFKSYAGPEAKTIPAKPPFSEANLQSLMPWTMYAGMTEQDLGAIYDYLRTVKRIKNKVEKFSNY